MVNKIFVFCFFIFLFMMAQCQSNLQNAEFDDDDDDQLFNETMADVVLMTGEVDNLINELSTVTLSDKHVEFFIQLVPVMLLGIAVEALTVSVGVAFYNFYRNVKSDSAAERAKIIADERYQQLLAENKKLIAEVTRIADAVHETETAIVAKLDQVIATMIQQDFNTKVDEPMNILMRNYDILMNTLADQAVVDLNVTCQAKPANDIITIMTSKTMDMYKEHLTKSVLDEGYNLISQLEDGYLIQYVSFDRITTLKQNLQAMIYPFCTILANGPPENGTDYGVASIVNYTLNSAMKPRNYANDQRNQVFWNFESWGTGELDLRTVVADAQTNRQYAEAIYGFIAKNFGNLREPVSNANYGYVVFTFDQNAVIKGLALKNRTDNHQVSLEKVFGQERVVQIYGFGLEKVNDTSLKCDFIPNEDGTLPPQLRDELCNQTATQSIVGIFDFVDSHCTYDIFIPYYCTLDQSDSEPCKTGHHADSSFKEIKETCESTNVFVKIIYN